MNADKRTDKQVQSFFLNRLPPEIRFSIYRQCLLGPEAIIHICEYAGRLRGARCIADPKAPRLVLVPQYTGSWGIAHAWCQQLVGREKDRGISWGGDFLNLLLTCRQFYLEVIEILYSSTTLSFIGLAGIEKFICTVSSACLHTVKSLQLSWFLHPPSRGKDGSYLIYGDGSNEAPAEDGWHAACAVLARMQSLTTVEITLYNSDRMSPELLAPLSQIKANKTTFKLL